MEELIRTTTGGPHRRLHRRADSGRRRLHHAAQGVFPDRREDRAQSRRHLHQRRSADRLGPHRRQVVRHRAVGRDARHHDQRQGPRQRQPHRPDRGASPKSPMRSRALTISTFGGNPVAATAAKAVIDFIEEQNLHGQLHRDRRLPARAACENCRTSTRSSATCAAWACCRPSNWWRTARPKRPATAADRAVDGSRARERPADRQGRACTAT